MGAEQDAGRLAELQARCELLDNVLDTLGAHVFMKDRDGRFLYVNRATAELFHLPPGEIVGRRDLDFFEPAVVEPLRQLDMLVLDTREPHSQEERLVDDEGEDRYYWSIKAPYIQDGVATAVVGMSADITDLHYYRLQLQRLAHTDPLTGVANRRSFYESAASLAESARLAGSELWLMVIDVDLFKMVNDTLGHLAGDEILQQLTSRLQGAARQGDFLARTGGEEFALLMPGADAGEAMECAQRLLASVRGEPYIAPGGIEIAVTVSAGLATLTDRDRDMDAVYGRADRALYQAKEAGRDRVVLAPADDPGGRTVSHGQAP